MDVYVQMFMEEMWFGNLGSDLTPEALEDLYMDQLYRENTVAPIVIGNTSFINKEMNVEETTKRSLFNRWDSL